MDDALDRPGCFGSAVIRAGGHVICEDCPFARDCAAAADTNRRVLAEELGVDDLPRAHKCPAQKPAPAPAAQKAEKPRVAGLTSKGQKLVDTLGKRGITGEQILHLISLDSEARESRMRNWKPEFLKTVIHRLADGDRISKAELREAFERDLNWGRTTASSHVAIVTNALTHLGVVTEHGQELRRGDHA